MALHKVFDAPEDKIVWDVGHQAYVHKVLTGRRDRMSSIRQAGGLSGKPERFLFKACSGGTFVNGIAH